tara:strand:- start:330 stop:650 length:321 start_codon:yes stop_codon:yes gene_type:complete
MLLNFRELIDSVDETCTLVLGEKANFTLSDSSVLPVNVIFSENYYDYEAETGNTFLNTQPNIVFKSNDLSEAVKIGQKVSVRDVNYTIEKIEDEGEGLKKAFLTKV